MARNTLARPQAFKVAALMTQWQAVIAERKLTLTRVWEDVSKAVDFPITRANVKRVARDLGIELALSNRAEGTSRAHLLKKRVDELESRVIALETSLGVEPKKG